MQQMTTTLFSRGGALIWGGGTSKATYPTTLWGICRKTSSRTYCALELALFLCILFLFCLKDDVDLCCICWKLYIEGKVLLNLTFVQILVCQRTTDESLLNLYIINLMSLLQMPALQIFKRQL